MAGAPPPPAGSRVDEESADDADDFSAGPRRRRSTDSFTNMRARDGRPSRDGRRRTPEGDVFRPRGAPGASSSRWPQVGMPWSRSSSHRYRCCCRSGRGVVWWKASAWGRPRPGPRTCKPWRRHLPWRGLPGCGWLASVMAAFAPRIRTASSTVSSLLPARRRRAVVWRRTGGEEAEEGVDPGELCRVFEVFLWKVSWSERRRSSHRRQ